MKCIAIDDEPIALEIIKKFCNQMGGGWKSKLSATHCGAGGHQPHSARPGFSGYRNERNTRTGSGPKNACRRDADLYHGLCAVCLGRF